MASDRNLYLVAVVVMALGLGNSLIKKHLEWIDDVSGGADTLVSWASDHASDLESRFEDRAENLFGRGESRVAHGQYALARAEAKLACEQSRIAQRQAEMVRVQAEHARATALDQMQRVLIQQQKDQLKILKQPAIPHAVPNNDTI
jgi:hypothetical protein